MQIYKQIFVFCSPEHKISIKLELPSLEIACKGQPVRFPNPFKCVQGKLNFAGNYIVEQAYCITSVKKSM